MSQQRSFGLCQVSITKKVICRYFFGRSGNPSHTKHHDGKESCRWPLPKADASRYHKGDPWTWQCISTAWTFTRTPSAWDSKSPTSSCGACFYSKSCSSSCSLPERTSKRKKTNPLDKTCSWGTEKVKILHCINAHVYCILSQINQPRGLEDTVTYHFNFVYCCFIAQAPWWCD